MVKNRPASGDSTPPPPAPLKRHPTSIDGDGNEEHAEKKAKEEVQKYTFFNRKLRQEANRNGDIYDEKLSTTQKEWAIESVPEQPYLQHVKSLSLTWPTLGLLADFMEIGTSPLRWESLKGNSQRDVRAERTSRTEVTRVDYLSSGRIISQRYGNAPDLRAALVPEVVPTATATATATDEKRNFRLFIVEDLSREVIEALGARYDVEPHFFREHIFDYAWYNTRDRWAYPPRFNMLVRRQRWMQLRFTTARYFRTSNSFKEAVKETEWFNVYRRTEDDTNNRALWDEEDAKVGISRSRASFWLSHEDQDGERVGILLVDPTIKAGFPLWYGYGNWEETPSMNAGVTTSVPPRKSLYADLIYWAKKPATLGFPTQDATSFPQIPIQALLYLVASEWLIISEYIKTRLGQIEWEISYPEHFLARESNIDVPLKKLHIWRRLVPLYREMLNETLQGVFSFPCHTIGTSDSVRTSALPPPSLQSGGGGVGGILTQGGAPQSSITGPKAPIQEEFARALSYMEEYQQRIDRLTSVVTAIISIGDSRHSQEDNHNVARLTWLATFFIPLSFVTGLFSMTADVTSLSDTFKWFAAAGVPLSCISVGLGLLLTLPQVQKWLEQTTKSIDAWIVTHRPRRRRRE